MQLDKIEVITLFVAEIETTKAFYKKVFSPEIVYEDAVSAVLQFGGVMVNLLKGSEADKLVTPMKVAPAGAGASALFTVRVDDADTTYAELVGVGVQFLNGPINRPWGRRTAAFADPSGHVWEIAQVLG